MKIPGLRDARWLQLAVLLGYAIVAREVFHFERSHVTTAGCLAVAIGLDLLLGRFWFRKTNFPLSAAIIGLASSLLIDARTPYPYLAVAALGILSKAFLTYNGRHIFNPANFGVCVALLLAPQYVTGMPQLFSGYLAPSIVFAILGLITVWYARQLEVSLSWLAGFALFALPRALLGGTPVLLALAPLAGPGLLLYTFHMISDPATTPRTRVPRIAYGFAVAAGDALFRQLEIPYGNFYALLVVCAFLPWIREWELTKAQNIPLAS
jgi:Na+-translocating ferredoxin:NAD+ oxidoreductase RnfD subunit